jgi:hypothetical protein
LTCILTKKLDGGIPPQIDDYLMTPYGPPDKSVKINFIFLIFLKRQE